MMNINMIQENERFFQKIKDFYQEETNVISDDKFNPDNIQKY